MKRRRLAGQLALGALAGAVAALGHAPFSLIFLSLPGFAGVFWIFSRAGDRRAAAAVNWAAGAGYFAVALAWIVEPFFVDAARHAWMAPFALVFMAGGLALFWGAAGYVARRIAGNAASPAVLGLAWTGTLSLAEYARSMVMTGFPWALPGYVWTDTGIAQLAAIVGPHGLNFLTLGLAAALAGAAFPTRPARLSAVLAAVASLVVPGVISTLTPPAPGADGPLLRLVQPNAPQHQKWRPDMIEVFYRRGLELTAAPAEARPELVIWPETSLPQLLDRAGPILAEISEAAHGVPAVVGAMRRTPGGLFNSLAVIDGNGALAARYDKHHLVPFGEYTPLLPWIAALGWDGYAFTGFTPGPGPAVLDAGPGGSFMPLICYEVIFPDEIRAAPSRPAWLLQITNDAWFGNFSGPYQHLQQARMRAIETGLPLVRAANTGVSAVIDARGQVVASLPLGQAGQLDARLPAALPPTPYWRLGDLPFLALVLLCGVATLYQARRNRH